MGQKIRIKTKGEIKESLHTLISCETNLKLYEAARKRWTSKGDVIDELVYDNIRRDGTRK